MPVLSLSIGSNIDAATNIRVAIAALREHFGELDCSTVYESEAIGFEGDNFLNLVATVDTSERLADLIDFLKALEDRLGRDRNQPKFSGRTMDIDILTYGDNTGADCGITLPRAEITRNAFVLRPLAELLPDAVHSQSGLSFAELWQRFDQASQRLWPIEFDW